MSDDLTAEAHGHPYTLGRDSGWPEQDLTPTPPDLDAVVDAVVDGTAVPKPTPNRAPRRRHLVAVPDPAPPQVAGALQTVAHVVDTRTTELDEWAAHQQRAYDAATILAAHLEAHAAARLRLRWLPPLITTLRTRGQPRARRDRRRDHRPPPRVRVNGTRADDAALVTYSAARYGRRVPSWYRRVKLGTGETVTHRVRCGEHNPAATRGEWTYHVSTVVHGRYEPTRAALSVLVALSAATGYGLCLGAVWAVPRALAAISALAGKAATILLLAAIITAWIRSADKPDPKEHP